MADNGAKDWRHALTGDDTESYYRSLLPSEVVQWALVEAPIPFSLESIHGIYVQLGVKTLSALKEAMAMDCDRAYKDCHGTHPQAIKAK